MADHRVASRLGAVLRPGEGGHVRHKEEGEGADPVGPVALVPGHDEGGAGADRTERPDHERVDALIGEKKAGAIVEAVPVIVTGIGAVAPDPDVGVGDEAIERDPLERALENSLHDETEGWQAAQAAMACPVLARANAGRRIQSIARSRFSRQERGSAMPVVGSAAFMKGSWPIQHAMPRRRRRSTVPPVAGGWREERWRGRYPTALRGE